MKKFIKNWWFSIMMFMVAIAITLWVTIGHFAFASDDDFIYSLLMINCLSPILLIITIGVANAPKKEIEN